MKGKGMKKDPKRPDDLLSNGSAEEALNYFYRRLKQLNSSSGKVDELLKLLREMQEGSSVDREDEEMLSLIIDDALRGIDIASRYPVFFKKLLANEELREAFLDSLDLLEQSRAGALEPLPAAPSQDLDFLYRDEPEVKVENRGSGQWFIAWRQTAEQLQRILSVSGVIVETSHDPEAVFAEEEWFTFFNHRTQVESKRLEVALEGILSKIEPAPALRVVATIGFIAGENYTGAHTARLKAALHWGEFEQTAPLDARNQVFFSPIPLATIMDATGKKVVSPLLLTVELSE
jgi:hypothetical protein